MHAGTVHLPSQPILSSIRPSVRPSVRHSVNSLLDLARSPQTAARPSGASGIVCEFTPQSYAISEAPEPQIYTSILRNLLTASCLLTVNAHLNLNG